MNPNHHISSTARIQQNFVPKLSVVPKMNPQVVDDHLLHKPSEGANFQKIHTALEHGLFNKPLLLKAQCTHEISPSLITKVDFLSTETI